MIMLLIWWKFYQNLTHHCLSVSSMYRHFSYLTVSVQSIGQTECNSARDYHMLNLYSEIRTLDKHLSNYSYYYLCLKCLFHFVIHKVSQNLGVCLLWCLSRLYTDSSWTLIMDTMHTSTDVEFFCPKVTESVIWHWRPDCKERKGTDTLWCLCTLERIVEKALTWSLANNIYNESKTHDISDFVHEYTQLFIVNCLLRLAHKYLHFTTSNKN